MKTPCKVCGEANVQEAAEIARLMRELIQRLHASPVMEPGPGQSWRFAVAHFESAVDVHLMTWSFALEGVCADCISVAAPETAARLSDPAGLHAEAAVRWEVVVPPQGPKARA